MLNLEIAKKIYDIHKKLKTKNRVIKKTENIKNDVAMEQIIQLLDSEYEKYDFIKLIDENEKDPLLYLQKLLESESGIIDVLNRIQQLLGSDDILVKISNVVLDNDGNLNEKCREEVFKIYNGEIDNLDFYWNLFEEISTLENDLNKLLCIKKENKRK